MMTGDKRVTYEASNYYLEILTIFMSAPQIARKMQPPVNPVTVYRWQDMTTPMKESQVRRLEGLMLDLAHRFRKRPLPFYQDLADALTNAVGTAPGYAVIEVRKRANKDTLMGLRELLAEALHDKTRTKANVVNQLRKQGDFTEAQIQRAATQLGIKKTVKGFGSKRRSYWSLKK